MKDGDQRNRVVITGVKPEVECGRFAAKRIIGEEVIVTADIFSDGHVDLSADLLFRHAREADWNVVSMIPCQSDRWSGSFLAEELGVYYFTLQGWVDHFLTWQKDLLKKFNAGQDVSVEIKIGIQQIQEALQNNPDDELTYWLTSVNATSGSEQAVELLRTKRLAQLMRDQPSNKRWVTEYHRKLQIVIDPVKARFSSWYEFFPRSAGQAGKHGTFLDCEKLLPDIAEMGFDVVYLPPIHPIGEKARRGKNNQPGAKLEEPGSPWAIGSQMGGHKDVHSSLGTIEDFRRFLKKGAELGISVAIDLAFQCSPDHPYVREHPEWFRWRPDGSIQFAENPPKKYEDIVPFDFETEDWKGLWKELQDVVEFWVEQGVTIFRVDNPHGKPFAFWEWLLRELKEKHPQLIFLSEAFTRPKVMYWLAKLGFTQSYTYFAWRYTKKEITEYLKEVTSQEVSEYFRPNFWPNTPDILTEELQHGGRAAFMIRLILAATLSSNYGIYGPAFELMVNKAVPGKEEYLDSEKYELRRWIEGAEGSLRGLIKEINLLRRENRALQETNNLAFYEIDNDHMLCYAKVHGSTMLLIVVSLDPFSPQTGVLELPSKELGLEEGQTYRVSELLGGKYEIWKGEKQKIVIDSREMPARMYQIQRRVKREGDFEYF